MSFNLNKSNLVDYYKNRNFNPVPISLDTKEKWENHSKKRINLLQNHLRIPLHLLNEKHVLEFGCNSGENTLILADFGAHLTLVEPNEHVIPKLKSNFKAMNLDKQIHGLFVSDIEHFNANKQFDLVIAEGFLNTLQNRDKLLGSLLKMCKGGGLLVINYDDRYGGYLELLKSCILKRVCTLDEVDFRSEVSLELARKLFEKSFNRLNASRPFEAWWEDQLVNPFASCLWSLEEIINVDEKQDFQCYSNSPVFPNPNLFQWYKNVNDNARINSKIMDAWYDSLAYVLTGKKDQWRSFVTADKKVVESLFDHTATMADYISDDNGDEFDINFPTEMIEFFISQGSQYFKSLCDELIVLYKTLHDGTSQEIIQQYCGSITLQNTWGTALHYVCLMKN